MTESERAEDGHDGVISREDPENPERPTSSGGHEPAESPEPADSDADEWRRVAQAHYDRENEGELATTIVLAISDAKGVSPLDYAEMPPLYEFVDAQALEDTFFGPQGSEPRQEEPGSVTFTYTGYKVTLGSDGWISVYEPLSESD